MLKKSGCGVGEQQKRSYNWAFNPDDHVFGKKKTPIIDGVKNCLNNLTLQQDTRTVPPRVNVAKQLRNEFMGLSATNRYVKKNNPQI